MTSSHDFTNNNSGMHDYHICLFFGVVHEEKDHLKYFL